MFCCGLCLVINIFFSSYTLPAIKTVLAPKMCCTVLYKNLQRKDLSIPTAPTTDCYERLQLRTKLHDFLSTVILNRYVQC